MITRPNRAKQFARIETIYVVNPCNVFAMWGGVR